MNRPIRKVAIALGVLLAAIFVNLNFVQVVHDNAYKNKADNKRQLLSEYSRQRGQIVVQGSAIATSKKTDGILKYLRQYTNPEVYAGITGYMSSVYGTTELEQAENEVLDGSDPRQFGRRFSDIIRGRDPKGGSVALTINNAAQRAAYAAMKDPNGNLRRGAVVAIDPTTGAILAAVSTPSYDPNELASHDADVQVRAFRCYLNPAEFIRDSFQNPSAAQRKDFPKWAAQELAMRSRTSVSSGTPSAQDWDPALAAVVDPPRPCGRYTVRSHGRDVLVAAVADDPTAIFRANPSDPGPLVNRAFNELYAPGSVFKVIVSAAALKKGVKPTDRVPAPNSYWPLGGSGPCPANHTGACVENFEGETCQDGKTAQLAFALAKSCNTAFAQLAVQRLGGQDIEQQAKAFGFGNSNLDVPLAVATSTVGDPNTLENDDAALAQTSFGQRDVRVTPLQAAMLSAAVANSGTLMKPYLVQQELGSNLSVLSDTKPQTLGQALDPKYNQDLQSMMEGVVTAPEGTGHSAAITDLPGVTVGGKTGTADTGVFDANGQPTPPHAWFSGFALVNGDPKIAVAVIIENGGVNGDETTGGLAAAPVAKAVMEAYLRSAGGR
jgi:cell division protein FtsI/penicillin-binding protein 2